MPEPTVSQISMFVTDALAEGSAFRLIFDAEIEGPLDLAALLRSVEDVILRHEALRTGFVESLDGYRCVVHDAPPEPAARVVPNPALDELGAPLVGEPEALAAVTDAGEPPVRFVVYALGAHRHVLRMAVHHASADGWAIGVVMRELAERYDALVCGMAGPLPPGPTAAVRERVRSELEESGECERELAFWREKLAGAGLASADVAGTSTSTTLRTGVGFRRRFIVGRDLCDAAAAQGVTAFTLFAAALALVASEAYGSPTVILGMATAGRTDPRLDDLVGLVANMVPLVVGLDPSASVAMLLEEVGLTIAEALDNSHVAFERIVGAMRRPDAPGRPLVDVGIGMHAQLIPGPMTAGGTRWTVAERHGGGSPLDCTLYVQQLDTEVVCALECDRGVFDDASARAWVGAVSATLEELPRHPDRSVSELRGRAARRAGCAWTGLGRMPA